MTRKRFKSPLRIDRKPSCGFYLDPNRDVKLHDFSEGKTYGIIEVAMQIHNLSYYQAISFIKNDLKFTHRSEQRLNNTLHVYNGVPAKIDVKFRKFTKTDENYWGQYGLTEDYLRNFDVYSVGKLWLNKNLYYEYHHSNPAYGYYFGGDEWKIYFPYSKENRFLSNTRVLQGYNKLPKTGKELVLQKSYKDVICMSKFGIPAVAKQSESNLWTEEEIKDLTNRFDTVISLYDNDNTGRKFALRIYKNHNIYPLFITDDKAKDFSDFVAVYGDEGATDLIKKAREFIETN